MKRFLVAMFVLVMGASLAVAGEGIKKTILYSDLNQNCEIIGPLGVALGTLVDMEAKVLPDPVKGFSNWLEVLSVEGTRLKTPVKIHYRVFPWAKNTKKLTVNEIYTLRAYQDGGMIGIPDAVMKETVDVQTQGYHFAVKLVIIDQK